MKKYGNHKKFIYKSAKSKIYPVKILAENFSLNLRVLTFFRNHLVACLGAFWEVLVPAGVAQVWPPASPECPGTRRWSRWSCCWRWKSVAGRLRCLRARRSLASSCLGTWIAGRRWTRPGGCSPGTPPVRRTSSPTCPDSSDQTIKNSIHVKK